MAPSHAAPPDASRRLFLKVGAGFSAAVACTALLPALTGCGTSDTPPAPGLAYLKPADVALFRAVLPAIAIELEPMPAAQRHARIDAALKNIDGSIAAMGQNGQAELRKLLDLLSSTPLRWALAGIRTPWEAATLQQVRNFLARWRGSRFATLNAGGVVLVKLASVGYFVLPDTWEASGYPGPNPAVYRALQS